MILLAANFEVGLRPASATAGLPGGSLGSDRRVRRKRGGPAAFPRVRAAEVLGDPAVNLASYILEIRVEGGRGVFLRASNQFFGSCFPTFLKLS